MRAPIEETAHFTVTGIDELTLAGDAAVVRGSRSPFVRRIGSGYVIAVVSATDSTGSRIFAGTSDDGVRFALDDTPIVIPDTADDAGGCDDPAIVAAPGSVAIFYSGLDPHFGMSRLLWASGPDLKSLQKHGRVLPYLDREIGSKRGEAFVAPSGEWRLYFERTEEHTRIALSTAPHLEGPWSLLDAPFSARAARWDDTHISPGPIVERNGKRTMFYNGADAKGRWQVGSVELGDDGLARGARADAPLIAPSSIDAAAGESVFCFSAEDVGDDFMLYAAVGDRRFIRVRVSPNAATR